MQAAPTGETSPVVDNSDELTNQTTEAPTTMNDAGEAIWDSLLTLWTDFLNHVPYLVAGVVVLIVTWLVALIVGYLVKKIIDRDRFGRSFRDLIRQLSKIGVWVVGIMISAIIVFPGMTPAKVLAGLGLSSIAIGFAFKDIVENFFAGILILWKIPFDPGDFIEVGDIIGKVEEITIRMTNIRQTDGQLVVLPNATLFKEPVNVLTSLKTRRITVVCGVAYDEDVDASREVIQKAVATCDTVNQEKSIEIFAQEFAASSINFEVTWWTGSTPVDIRRSRDQVVAAVKRSLDEAGIEIPFPYRTLTFKEPLHTQRVEKENTLASEQD